MVEWSSHYCSLQQDEIYGDLMGTYAEKDLHFDENKDWSFNISAHLKFVKFLGSVLGVLR